MCPKVLWVTDRFLTKFLTVNILRVPCLLPLALRPRAAPDESQVIFPTWGAIRSIDEGWGGTTTKENKKPFSLYIKVKEAKWVSLKTK